MSGTIIMRNIWKVSLEMSMAWYQQTIEGPLRSELSEQCIIGPAKYGPPTTLGDLSTFIFLALSYCMLHLNPVKPASLIRTYSFIISRKETSLSGDLKWSVIVWEHGFALLVNSSLAWDLSEISYPRFEKWREAPNWRMVDT